MFVVEVPGGLVSVEWSQADVQAIQMLRKITDCKDKRIFHILLTKRHNKATVKSKWLQENSHLKGMLESFLYIIEDPDSEPHTWHFFNFPFLKLKIKMTETLAGI